jgi:hypothetical protein
MGALEDRADGDKRAFDVKLRPNVNEVPVTHWIPTDGVETNGCVAVVIIEHEEVETDTTAVGGMMLKEKIKVERYTWIQEQTSREKNKSISKYCNRIYILYEDIYTIYYPWSQKASYYSIKDKKLINNKKVFINTSIKSEKCNIKKKKIIRKNGMRSLQKIEVFTKIPNNDNKKSQKSRKISKLNSKKLQNSRKFSTKLRKIIQNLTKNKKSQINILDNIEIKIKHKRKIIWIPTLYHHLTPQLKLLRLVGLGKNKKNSPPKQKWMQQDWQNLRTNCKILQ